MKVTQMPPVHAANLVVNNGNTAYGVDVIRCAKTVSGLCLYVKRYLLLQFCTDYNQT